MFDLNYGAVKISVEQLGGPLGVEVVTVPFPISAKSDDDIVSALELFFDEKGPAFVESIKLAFFEHVTSPTAIRLPVKRLIQLCRGRGIRTMIDGAHALGLFDLDLSDIDPDYYVCAFSMLQNTALWGPNSKS
jgi:isopenicillin-N epimerase